MQDIEQLDGTTTFRHRYLKQHSFSLTTQRPASNESVFARVIWELIDLR